MRKGFTFIEIALVIIIIGLLLGGVFYARSLIKQAEIRASISEVGRITKSIQMFLDKYGQFPGDFTQAAAFWGADAGCPGTGFNTDPKKATCSGNGDNTIGTCCYGDTTEWYRAWQHLADAEMLDGQFTGVGGNVTGPRLLGMSVPRSSYTGGGYTLLFAYVDAITTESFAYTPQHLIEFGSVRDACAGGASAVDCITNGPLLKPLDALDIDKKLDDGKPGLGKVRARPSTSTINPGCTSTADPLTSAYNVGNGNPLCALQFNTGY